EVYIGICFIDLFAGNDGEFVMLMKSAGARRIRIGKDVGVIDHRGQGALNGSHRKTTAADLGSTRQGIVEQVLRQGVIVPPKGAAKTQPAGEFVFCETA